MKEIGSWIPQIFYDLIGRITPGAVTICIILTIFKWPQDLLFVSERNSFSSAFMLIVGLVFSYMVGALLGGFSFIFDKNFWDIKGKLNLKKDCCLDLNNELDLNDKSTVSFLYDSILFKKPDVGARLSKLRAEQHMCRAIMLGSFIIALSYIIGYIFEKSKYNFAIVLILLILIMFCAFFLKKHLQNRLTELMENNWCLLLNENKPIASNNDTTECNKRR